MKHSGTEVSVVIATVGRSRQLERTLREFENLDTGTPPFEVVVVLDGEDEASRRVCDGDRPFELRVEGQERAGAGSARNRGARAASGDLVILFNDDTRPHPRCLIEHAAAQRRLGPFVAVGRVDWDPELEITPYMAWLAPAGHQFNYARLDRTGPIPWDACWSTNLAIPRSWVCETPFDPELPGAGLEDSEWGYRLARRGRPLRYVPEAVCYHDHRYDGPSDYRGRARAAGAASRYVANRHRELAWTLMGRPSAAAAIRAASLLWPGNWRREMLWDLDYRANYVFGMFSR